MPSKKSLKSILSNDCSPSYNKASKADKKKCESAIKKHFHKHKKHSRTSHKRKNNQSMNQSIVINNNIQKGPQKGTETSKTLLPQATGQGVHMDVPYSNIINQEKRYSQLLKSINSNRAFNPVVPPQSETNDASSPPSSTTPSRKERSDKGKSRGPYKKTQDGDIPAQEGDYLDEMEHGHLRGRRFGV
jgi:hypothetical protein